MAGIRRRYLPYPLVSSFTAGEGREGEWLGSLRVEVFDFTYSSGYYINI